MKAFIITLSLSVALLPTAWAQSTPEGASKNYTRVEQDVVNLSKAKWDWMAEKKTEPLDRLFHDKSMFVHMGGSWGKAQELDVIRKGNIWYKKAHVYTTTLNVMGNTAILLSDMDLVAVVGGNEVVNPFMVTEVYVREKSGWKMGSLTFSKLMRGL